MQAVGELNDDDAHVLGHGQEHLAHAVELLIFFGTVIETAQFGDAVDEEGHFLAEHLLEVVQGIRRIFDDIVEERRRNGRRVYFHICQYLCHRQGMQDIRFPADAALVLMGLFGQLVGFGHIIAFGLRQIRMYRIDEVFKFDIFIFKFHNMKTSLLLAVQFIRRRRMEIHFPRKDRKIISWAVVIMAHFEDADFPQDDDGSINGVDVVAVPLGRSQTAADLPDRHAPVGDALLEGHVDIDHDRPIEDDMAMGRWTSWMTSCGDDRPLKSFRSSWKATSMTSPSTMASHRPAWDQATPERRVLSAPRATRRTCCFSRPMGRISSTTAPVREKTGRLLPMPYGSRRASSAMRSSVTSAGSSSLSMWTKGM